MGHAGAIISGGKGGAEDKIAGNGERGHPRFALAGATGQDARRRVERQMIARRADAAAATEMSSMTRQDFNQALLQTSFLYGANAPYIEELQAKYEKDPASVEPGWRDFFAALGDDPASVEKGGARRLLEKTPIGRNRRRAI